MKAIRIDHFGGPQVMELSEVDIPQPQAGEVLVKNFAVGVNPVDYKIREGEYPEVRQDKLPLTMGREIAGTVEALGEGVSGFEVGHRVFAMIGADGGYAQYSRVPVAHLATSPPPWTGATRLAFLWPATPRGRLWWSMAILNRAIRC